MDAESREDMIKVAPVIMWSMPALVLKMAVSYMRIKRKSRRAVKSFREGLRSEGLPPEVAESLCGVYDENTSIFRRLVSSAMHGGFASMPK